MFGFDRRFIYIIIAVMALSFLTSMNTDKLLSLVLTIPGVIIAMTFHEYAHAKAADKLGDDTPRMQGRLNLNPFSHVNPIGMAMLVFAGFGWGRPVEINPRNFNRNMELTKAEAIVSVAGPAINFILAFVFMIILHIILLMGAGTSSNSIMPYIIQMVAYTVSINLGLGVFNLIPLPPLDGSKILYHFLPFNGRQWFENNQMYFYIGFLIIFITGIAGDIISPIIGGVYNVYSFVIGQLFSLFI